ncbi:MAG: hypothetical protein PWQ72_613 [Pseudothermotoga sp.]|jgi:CRISPR/Cas system-associated endoribonuclease Cas2|nr:MAG: Uncharacterized protein XD56_2004 [Pseudothermotoga lettingae]MDI3494486.1 hypothetical protein [Pseudothermotoga sp.]MDK2884820.1 hypothetical protein [Pseudothermotoga sp.]
MIYFLKESPFGDDIYVVVVKESEKIAEKLSKLYQQAKDEIAVVVLTLEEYRNFETLLSEKGEKLY